MEYRQTFCSLNSIRSSSSKWYFTIWRPARGMRIALTDRWRTYSLWVAINCIPLITREIKYFKCSSIIHKWKRVPIAKKGRECLLSQLIIQFIIINQIQTKIAQTNKIVSIVTKHWCICHFNLIVQRIINFSSNPHPLKIIKASTSSIMLRR